MNRVQRLKEIKARRRRLTGFTVLLFSLIFIGIGITDYSFNSLMENEKRIKIISFKNCGNSRLEISFMNKSIYMNTRFIERDLHNLKAKMLKIIEFR